MPINIPNLLTWLRILLIPVFVSFFYLSNDTLSTHLQNVVSTVYFCWPRSPIGWTVIWRAN